MCAAADIIARQQPTKTTSTKKRCTATVERERATKSEGEQNMYN